MIVFSDLHLREQTEDICFGILAIIEKYALQGDKWVICCGDFWHIRYQLPVRLLNRVKELFADWEEKGIQVDLVPGNHDQVSVDGRNALEVLASDSCRVWTYPGLAKGYGFVPYRRDPKEQLAALKIVSNSKAIFAHCGIQGAWLNSKEQDKDGIVLDSSFPPLILGHYHRYQIGDNWCYVGSPYQMDFGEAHNECGFFDWKKEIDFRKDRIRLEGAPLHYLLEWDPHDPIPEHPGNPQDKVRIDIVGTWETTIGRNRLLAKLRRAGFEKAQINVACQNESRKHRFEIRENEPLAEAAKRFAQERFQINFGQKYRAAAMAALESWR